VLLPKPDAEIIAKSFDEGKGEVGGFFGSMLSKIDVKVKIAHEGEVNRARVMPQNPFFIATKAPSSTVFVFDYSKHSSFPTDNVCRPQHKLLGHELEGYGLSWSPHNKGQILSGSDDKLICLWDITEAKVEVDPLQKREGHTDVVEDVDWHKTYPTFFGSVGDDSKLIVWDSRHEEPVHEVHSAHKSDVNCISFNPFNEFLLATGGLDQVVAMWDLRNMKQPVHQMKQHDKGNKPTNQVNVPLK
jgi:histone-binding protein RBBP4